MCTAVEPKPHVTNAVDLAGYISWGSHSTLGRDYAIDGKIQWGGSSSWYVVQTIESYKGVRFNNSASYPTYQASFLDWFSAAAFGGVGSSNTPVGGVSHVDEPSPSGVNDPIFYFGLWARGKSFAICAWQSRNTSFFQALGDPLVSR